MKGALVGIIAMWVLIGAIAGVIWMFDNHPEVASWLAFAAFVTIAGAAAGWAFTS